MKEGEDMKWKDVARATALALGPLALLAALLEVRLASGMGPWDTRLTCVLAVMVGMWMVHAAVIFGPRPEPQPEPEQPEGAVVSGPLADILSNLAASGAVGRVQAFGWGGGKCDECGEVHSKETMVLIPLPDDTVLVTHKDRTIEGVECSWAVHAGDQDAATSAARFHEEFQCARRHANT